MLLIAMPVRLHGAAGQGYRIATGQSRDSMAVFLVRAGMVVVIVSIAQGLSLFGQDIAHSLLSIRDTIAGVLTGGEYEDAASMVGKVMSKMLALQVALDVFQGSAANATANVQMANTLSFITGAGQALPALIAGGLMLLNEIALHLCLVFGPICILAYVFEQTRFMFVAWVKFSITTLFSMVIITVVTVIALKAIIMLATALVVMDTGGSIVGLITNGNGSLQLRDIATVSGGLGMLLSTLIIGTPPLVTNFFSGALNLPSVGYNPMAQFAGGASGQRAPSSPQDLMNRTMATQHQKQEDQEGNQNTAANANKLTIGYNATTSAQQESYNSNSPGLRAHAQVHADQQGQIVTSSTSSSYLPSSMASNGNTTAGATASNPPAGGNSSITGSSGMGATNQSGPASGAHAANNNPAPLPGNMPTPNVHKSAIESGTNSTTIDLGPRVETAGARPTVQASQGYGTGSRGVHRDRS